MASAASYIAVMILCMCHSNATKEPNYCFTDKMSQLAYAVYLFAQAAWQYIYMCTPYSRPELSDSVLDLV